MSKLKIILSSIGSAIVGIFCLIFHIQRNKIKNLQSENKAKDGTINNYKSSTSISKETNAKTSEVKSNEQIKNDWYSKHPDSGDTSSTNK